MEENTIVIDFPFTKNDYRHLFSRVPAVKRLKWVVLKRMTGTALLAYMTMILIEVVLFSKPFHLMNRSDLIFVVCVTALTTAYLLWKMRDLKEKQITENYERYYLGGRYTVVYDLENNQIHLKPRDRTADINQVKRVISKPNAYYFYFMHEGKEDLFFIPKTGEGDHQTRLRAILKDINEREGIRIMEK
ncbi:hypothetical protein RGU11_18520 [Rossellomorea marisflavi]|uniref:hypothetical protein n=1 Tax=Rossellomorea marisflavi TaxID=189381 RepID=UPI0028530E97|nr:hypothetical protein [Rossellomorea marisflavi]MDR4938378.1 hypothetical protein [Rossellomorea marisflavi]